MAKNKVEKRKFIEDIFGLEIFSDMLSIVRANHLELKKTIDTETTKLKEINNSYSNYNIQKNKTLEFRKNKLNVYLERQRSNAVTKELLLDELNSVEDININDIEIKNKKLKDILDICENKITEKIEIISDLKASLSNNVSGLTKIDSGHSKCPTCLRPVTSIDKDNILCEIKGLQEIINSQKEKITVYTKHLQDTKNKKESIIKSLKINEDQISNLKLIDQKKQNISDKINQIDIWQDTLVQDIEQMRDSSTEFDIIIAETLERSEIASNTIQKLSKEINDLDIIKYVVSEEGVKSYIVNKLLELLNSKLRYYLKKLDSNAICYFNEFFEEEIINEKNKICSYFNFSGAERKSIDLACLFTFCDLRRLQGGVQYNIAIYDELFDSSFDEKGIELIVNILKERVHLYNESVYVISHRKESLKNVTGDTIYLEKKNGITTRVNSSVS